MDSWTSAIEKLEFEKVRQRVLRYTSSVPGKEFLQNSIISTSLDDIRLNLQRVSELKKLLEEEGSIPVDGIFPVRDAIKKASIQGTVLLGKELAQILSTLKTARAVKQFLSKRRESYPLIWHLTEPLYVDKVLEFNLERAIDESGSVRANASRELQSIRRTIAEKYDQLRKKLEGILKEATAQGLTQDEIITTREGRMVIPVKTEHKHHVHGFIHSASASGATVFIEPTETLDLNNEIRTLQFQEQQEVERILRELTQQIGDSHEALVANLLILAELDALTAKAKYSIEILGVEPQLSESGCVKLIQARHPLLILTHGRDGTVPLDIELGSGYCTLIISGPNAGGKSVAMKCVGLLTLMAQAGMHIPASEASVLRVFHKMFVEIGDEQSIENDLSTFSSHLSHLKHIEAHADADSLVLIDEIGSGTDPTEGSAIAAALLEQLTKRGTLTIATTHHGALKVFAHNTPGVENGAMEFDQESLRPTYRFKAGIPGSSYALEMAERLGFQEVLIRRSREFLGHEGARLQHLIAELEASVQKYRRELDAVQSEKARLDALVKQYENRLASQAKELKELKRKAVEEAKNLVEGANAAIERSIREIRETSADKQAVREARQGIEKLRKEIEDQATEVLLEEQASVHREIVPGTPVRLAGGTEIGEVVTISPDHRSAVVLFGNLKMKVAMNNLMPAPHSAMRRAANAVVDEKPTLAHRDLDLRGMTSDEAIPLVDKFIDTAILAGLHRVDIIHGKGTGALRRKIAEFLSKHPQVKSYRLGEWNEGGTGATVVELVEQ